MEELQVPTRRVTVTVHTLAEEGIRGELFVSSTPRSTGRAEDVIDVLNDERVFVPFSPLSCKEDPSILHKHHIARVCIESTDEDDGTDAMLSHDPFPCTLILRDGSRLTGGLLVDTPLSASRLVDKFNMAPRFMPFVSETGLQFIHRTCVVRVF